MRIIGNIVPFIGWRTEWVDNEGNPSEGPSHLKADVFQVEWLNRGVMLYVGKVYPA